MPLLQYRQRANNRTSFSPVILHWFGKNRDEEEDRQEKKPEEEEGYVKRVLLPCDCAALHSGCFYGGVEHIAAGNSHDFKHHDSWPAVKHNGRHTNHQEQNNPRERVHRCCE